MDRKLFGKTESAAGNVSIRTPHGVEVDLGGFLSKDERVPSDLRKQPNPYIQNSQQTDGGADARQNPVYGPKISAPQGDAVGNLPQGQAYDVSDRRAMRQGRTEQGLNKQDQRNLALRDQKRDLLEQNRLLTEQLGLLRNENADLRQRLQVPQGTPVQAPQATKPDSAPSAIAQQTEQLLQERAVFKDKWSRDRSKMQDETKGMPVPRAEKEDRFHREKLARDIEDLGKVLELLKTAEGPDRKTLLAVEANLRKDLKQSVDDWDFSEKAAINLRYDVWKGHYVNGLQSVDYRDKADQMHDTTETRIRGLIADPQANPAGLAELAAELRRGMLTSHEEVKARVTGK